jgi:hypothetical protein
VLAAVDAAHAPGREHLLHLVAIGDDRADEPPRLLEHRLLLGLRVELRDARGLAVVVVVDLVALVAHVAHLRRIER